MPFIQGTGTTGERIVRIPENVDYIIKILEENGFEAYAVGGCVRDMVMGREPDDWDITTSAEPLEVKALFHRTIDTGIQHGTVTVMIGNAAHVMSQEEWRKIYGRGHQDKRQTKDDWNRFVPREKHKKKNFS